MAHLRDSTADHHRTAEHHPFQTSLARGSISRHDFISHLGQMMLVHRAIEQAIAACPDPRIRSLAIDRRAADAAEDLRTFGRESAEFGPLPGTDALIRAIQSAPPARLLGMHYVLEGSKNGSRFIANSIRRGLGLSGPAGTRYLDPDGEAQRPRWAAFKQAMDATAFAPAEAAELVAGAVAMFESIGSISDDLLAASAPAVATSRP